ncbi:MAG: amidohydrolase family protein, partial [Pirellulaceae bacterium]
VILNGRVMDPETNLDAVRNVGVKDGKISVITEDAITGQQTIDAKDHVVAPGFIDGHCHIVDSPLGQKGLLRDGVTTTLDLETGAFPVDTWYDNLSGKSQTNYGASFSIAAARTAAFNPAFRNQTGQFKSKTGNLVTDLFGGMPIGADWVNRVPTDDERKIILQLVEDGLKRGTLGVGPPTGYMTKGFTSQELIAIQELIGKYGRLSHVHTRFSSQTSPTSGILAFQEVFASAGDYGGGVVIAHFKAQSLALTRDVLRYVDALRDEGKPIVLEIYPYNYGAAGNGVAADYLKPENYQDNMGRTYSDITEIATGKPLTQARYEELVKTAPNTPVMFKNAKEADMLLGLAHPDVLIGSDAFPYTDPATGKMVTDWDTPWGAANTHPRTVGAHAKVLRLTREQNLMPLMLAISKMTWQYAQFLQDNGVPQMAFKGRMQVGCDADITIFDPATVRDNSSLDQGKNSMPSTGIPYVIVNGTIVVQDSQVLKGVYAGKPIRLPIQ